MMMNARTMIPLLMLGAACSVSSAQQAINISDDFPVPIMLLDRNHSSFSQSNNQRASQLQALTIEELSMMRSAGIDPSWIRNRFEIPEFNPSSIRAIQGDHPSTLESWTTHYTSGEGVPLNDDFRFSVGRTTDLRDGNISGSDQALDGSNDGHIASLEQSEGEYDIYDLAIEWEAVQSDSLTVSVISGLKAIEANIGKRISTNGSNEIDKVHRFTAIPMIGSGVRWQINENMSVSGAAITHPIDTGDALIDLNASTELRLSKNVDFSTGYRLIRSNFEVGSIDADLTQEGIFARIQISF